MFTLFLNCTGCGAALRNSECAYCGKLAELEQRVSITKVKLGTASTGEIFKAIEEIKSGREKDENDPRKNVKLRIEYR